MLRTMSRSSDCSRALSILIGLDCGWWFGDLLELVEELLKWWIRCRR